VVDELTHLPDDRRSSNLLIARLGGLVALLAAELLLLTVRFDSASLAGQEGWWARLIESAHVLPQLAVVIVTATFVFGGEALRTGFQQLGELAGDSRRWWLWCIAHAMLFAAFVPTTAMVFEGGPNLAGEQQLLAVCWALLGLAAVVCWCCALLPPATWIVLFQRHRLPLIAGIGIGAVAWQVGQLSDRLWVPLGQSTLWLVSGLLRLGTSNVIVHPSDFGIGTSAFVVQISPACSGYEGMGLASVFVGTYLWWCRRELRWPQAWLLLPLSIALMWLFNGARIAGLIVIGNSGWRDIALGGFHSQAGWMIFNLVVLGLVVYSRRSHYFLVDASGAANVSGSNPTAAYLLPLIALVASLMVTTAFTRRFDWLYPLRVVVVAGTLVGFARYYTRWNWSWSWGAVGIGVVVFGLWMVLERMPWTPLRNSQLGSDLASLPLGWAMVWLVFRVIGSVLVAPLAEELAFRGYLMRRLLAADFETVPATRFSWFALLVSSALFGALHPGRWLAGTLAGLLFALALYRRGNLVDAVLAHATSNAFIALYVLSTGSWDLWS
jgi:exosortase E/protease (VPEID-CTERM system)